MKVIRILVYKGSEDFIRASLESRAVNCEHITPNGTISEFYMQSPLPLSTEPPIDFVDKKKEK